MPKVKVRSKTTTKAKPKIRRSKQTVHTPKILPARIFGYRSYNFSDDGYDPIIDKLVAVINDGGLSWQEISEKSGVSVTTITAYVYHLTKRPRHSTVAAIFSVFGYDFDPVKRTANVVTLPVNRRK